VVHEHQSRRRQSCINPSSFLDGNIAYPPHVLLNKSRRKGEPMKLPTSQQETTMSKNNYSDIVALLDWATRQKKENKPCKTRKGPKNMTGFKAYMKFKQELEEFEKWEKEMLKKDVKQEKKKEGMSVPQIAMIFMGTFPITAPLYVWAVKQLLAQ